MSIHLYTSLSEREVRDSMGETASVEFLHGNGGLIRVDGNEVNFTIEPTVPDCPCSLRSSSADKDGRCKVNFFGYKPFEGETSLQKTMRLNEEVARVMISVTDALRPLSIIYTN